MSTFRRLPLVVAVTLLSFSAFASAEPAAANASADAEHGLAREAAPAHESSTQPLQVGLSDPDTRLVLPWFVTELVDAVNERRSLRDVAEGLAQGV
jgi:hypothetical protein